MQEPQSTAGIARVFTFITWLLLLGGLFWFFQDYLAKQDNPNQQLHSLRGGQGEVITELTRNRAGHYVGTALINQQKVTFLLDTGATKVAVPSAIAQQLGMPRGAAIQVMTANGVAQAWRSEIASLQLGDIVLTQVAASIVPNMGGTEILLGMSALKQLEFRQQGNQLTLIQRN